MIPIQEAIISQAWLKFSNRDYLKEWRLDQLKEFRVRVTGFSKINLNEVDSPELVDVSHANASWWMLELEVVSLCKKQMSTGRFNELILLVDQDGFQFNYVREDHLCFYSDFSQKNGFRRLHGQDLFPKIKAVGALTFLLPDDDEAQYYLSMESGAVCEA